MKSNSKFICSGAILLLASLFMPIEQYAQKNDSTTIRSGFDIKTESFLLPQRLPTGKYSHAIYVLYVIPPKDWTLDVVVAPMFNYSGKYTLPKGFNLQGSISTLIISNRINAGPFWNYEKGRCHFGVGFQVAFNYGFLRQFGFNTTLTGWENKPSLTAGYNFGENSFDDPGGFI